jgi:hypothetical protein
LGARHREKRFRRVPSARCTDKNVIEHKDPNIKVTQTVRGEAVPGGEASIERHYTTDGKESVNRLGPQDAKSTAKWDGNKVVIETKLETPDGTVEIKDSWELTEGGKQLVVSRNFNGDRQRLLFNKRQ